jgi:methionine aminotransferase
MSALAQQHNAINLSQGFPNFDPDPLLRRLVADAIDTGHNQYAPMQGLPALREIIARKILTLYGCEVNPDYEITITAGGTQAIFTAVGAVIQPGDEALIFDPAYDCYAPAVRVFGGIPKVIALRAPHFGIDWDDVERMISRRTKLIFINTPHNPLGRVFTEEDIRSLEKIVLKHKVFVISDEVYEHIIFDQLRHYSVLRSEVLSKKSFAIYSFGKLVHATGWKIGYCIAPAFLTSEFRKIHQFNVFAVNRPIQHALAEYLKNPQTYQDLNAFFEKKRDYFLEQMSGSRFQFLKCEGSYFILADYSGVSDLHDLAFAQKLTISGGVATIPLSPFYAHPVKNQRIVRFCFAKTEETLSKAAGMLKSIEWID